MAGQEDVLLACTIGDLAWLKRGLSRKLDPNSTNKEGLNGLHLAALNGKLRCMQYLLDNCSISVNKPAAASGSTALHYSISSTNGKQSAQCLKLLVERGANLNIQNKSGYSALHLAAKCGNVECMRVLLESGADIHIEDLDNSTAYSIACLHGQHECSRLLRALHWANEKDTSLQESLQEEAVAQNQRKEMAGLQTRLKNEAANDAYKSWLESNNVANSDALAPCACSQRKEARSKSNNPSSCATCSKMVSKHQSALQHEKPKLTQPMKVSLEQADRNVGSVGKPDKLYPYANHPPQHLRQHDSSGRETDISEPAKSPRTVSSYAAKSSRQIPIGVKYYSKMQKERVVQRSLSHPLATSSSAQNNTVEGEEDSDDSRTSSDEKMEDPNLQQLPFVFEDGECSEEDIAFHDVGYENSLDALDLPPALTKDKTPAEILQLLRGIGDPGSRSFRRAQSCTSSGRSRNGFGKRMLQQRRLSLGAIPEGRIVTSYSDEDGSQVLDEQFLATIMSQYSESSTAEHQQNEGDRGSLQWCEPDDKVEETISISTPSPQQAPLLTRRKVAPPTSLKIVNLAWDDTSASPHNSKLYPTPPAKQRPKTPTRKLTPPPAYISRKLQATPKNSKPSRKLTPPPSHCTPPHWKLHVSPFNSPARKLTPPRPTCHTLNPSLPNKSARTRKPTPPPCSTPHRKITPPSLPRSPYVYDSNNLYFEEEEEGSSPSQSPSPSPTSTPRRSSPHSPLLQDSTPPHSLFAMSPLASKSMVLDSSDSSSSSSKTDGNGDTSPKRRRSAPATFESHQNKRLLKPSVFEFGGVLTHT